MSNKQWVINETFSEKAKKSSPFLELESTLFPEIDVLKEFSAPKV